MKNIIHNNFRMLKQKHVLIHNLKQYFSSNHFNNKWIAYPLQYVITSHFATSKSKEESISKRLDERIDKENTSINNTYSNTPPSFASNMSPLTFPDSSLVPPESLLKHLQSGLISQSRTSTTSKLWLTRQQTNEISPSSYSLTDTSLSLPSFTDNHPHLYMLPSDSYINITLPFASDPHVYDDYVRFDGGVRFEKILEDMDAAAGNIAHRHVYIGATRESIKAGKKTVDLPPISIVTVTCDSIRLLQRFPMNMDVQMRGHVTYTGKSSMEVALEMVALKTSAETKKAEEIKLLDAYFLMAARNITTKSAYSIASLSFEHMTDIEREDYHKGEENAKRRKADSQRTTQPPTLQEIALIHNMIMNDSSQTLTPAPSIENITFPVPTTITTTTTTVVNASETLPIFPPSPLPPATIRAKICSMSSTEMNSTTMTQPQDRNTAGKIFGGYLMRGAYELARACAYVFAGPLSHPYFIFSNSISFLRPVEIGSVIHYMAKIIYSAGHPDNQFIVRVETKVRELITGKEFRSNSFEFCFKCLGVPIRKVEPNTYKEAIEWLEGKRNRERSHEGN